MKLNYVLSLTALLAFGCSNSKTNNQVKLPSLVTEEDNFYFDGLTLSQKEIREHWLTELSEKNPYLYMEVVKAFIVSKNTKRTVYVLKGDKGGARFYYASFDSGQGSDVISIDHKTREVRFDHFNEADGPSIWDSTQKIWINKKVKEINKEIEIGNFR